MSPLQTLPSLRSIIATTIDPLVPMSSPVALLDFPHHSNVGDSAIWLGEIEYLAKRACRIVYSCDAHNFCAAELMRALPSGVILLHGGGNFGDLYPLHQRFRERIVKEFQNHRIIQLPQSIHFSSEGQLLDSIALLSQHPDFHLLVRDEVSFALTQPHMPDSVRLCPDMALMLDLPDFKSLPKATDVVVLARTDKEKRVTPASAKSSVLPAVVTDWLEEPKPRHAELYAWAHRRLSWGSSKIPRRLLNSLALYATNRMARQRLARGIDLLSQGHLVITDRLHAMILSWLGKAPVIYLDNSYGKLSNFIQTWPLKGNLTTADSFEDALSVAARMLKR